MSDLISRQDVIDAVEHITSSMSVCVNTDECHGMKRMQRQAVIELANLPSTQTDKDLLHLQKEQAYMQGYEDGKKSRRGKWIDYSDEGHVECPFCHSATNCDGNKDELHYCFSCGAELR